MPFTGSTFSREENFSGDALLGPPHNTISADKMDGELDNFAAGLTTVKTAIDTHAANSADPHGSAAQAVATVRGGVVAAGDTLAKLYALLAGKSGRWAQVGAPVVIVPGTASVSFTGLTGNQFYIEAAGISHDGGSTVGFNVYLSTTNGVGYDYTSPSTLGRSSGSLVQLFGTIYAGSDAPASIELFTTLNGQDVDATFARHGLANVNAIRLRANAGSNLDAGTVRLFQRT